MSQAIIGIDCGRAGGEIALAACLIEICWSLTVLSAATLRC
jgi:hypothetical protein